MALEADLRAHLEEALHGQPDWLEIRHRIDDFAKAGEEARYRPFVFAFGYMLHERSRRARRERGEDAFGAAMSDGEWQFPPPLGEIEEQDVQAWQAAVEELDDLASAARLNDLLWERRATQRPDLFARAACDAYLVLSAHEEWHWVDRATCVTRALELAVAVKDQERLERSVRTAVSFVEAVLTIDDRAPGPAMVTLRALVDLDDRHQPSESAALLVRTSERWGDDPHIFQGVSELQARLASPEQLAEIRRAQVARWREAAEQGDAMLRVVFLEKALETARVHGLTRETDDLLRELQEISPDELDLETVTSEVALTDQEIAEVVDELVKRDSWQESLRQLGAQGPPGGSPEELSEEVRKEAEEFPLSRMFTKSVMGHGTAASRLKAVTDSQRQELDEAERRAFHATFWAVLFAQVLVDIPEHHGRPSKEALVAFFTTDLIVGAHAERIARAVELYWDNQPDESAHVLVPRLEAVLRDMARGAGLPIIREPVGDRAGGVRTLGVLLNELADALPDAGWHAYLLNLLTDERGLNLRNTIAHGLKAQINHGEAALLIHAACYLALLGVSVRHSPS